MLAHAPDVAYTTFATLFAALGFIPLAAMRAQMGPRGLLLCMGFTFSVKTDVQHTDEIKLRIAANRQQFDG